MVSPGAPVSDQQVDALLQAAMAAPSARNLQPWHFVVLRDPALLKQVPEAHPFAAMVPEAGLAICVCADPQIQPMEGYWAQDCSAATQNILLQATELGLGSVWLGVYPRQERMGPVRELLHIPEPFQPFSLVAIGHGAESKGPSERYDVARVHHDGW